jgi:hypothetical protein
MFKHVFLLMLLLESCSTQDIKLDIVRKTSDLLDCNRIFGYDTKRLYEENEILIQVGVIDTTTEHPPIEAAIVNIDNAEIVLNLTVDSVLNDRTIQEYSGNNYYLILDFLTITKSSFDGTCTIIKGKIRSTYHIVGITNPNL